MPDAVMLFAAGFGTRMGALTADRPKPLIQVAGRALLDHALDLTHGIPTRVVNSHYKADMIAAHLAGTDAILSEEWPTILDTGGGLRQALPILGGGPVYTLNTDAVWSGPNPLTLLRDAWAEGAEALLMCVPLDRAVGRQGGGDFALGDDGRLTRGGDLVYTGAQILRTERMQTMPLGPFSLTRMWAEMEAEGTLRGVVYPGRWADVGHPEGIALAEAMLADV